MVVPWAWSGHFLILLHAVTAQSNLNGFVRASAKGFWLSGEHRLLVCCWQRLWGKSHFIPALLLLSCSTCSLLAFVSGLCIYIFKRDSRLDHFYKKVPILSLFADELCNIDLPHSNSGWWVFLSPVCFALTQPSVTFRALLGITRLLVELWH